MVELYLQSHTHLHCVVLNKLNIVCCGWPVQHTMHPQSLAVATATVATHCRGSMNAEKNSARKCLHFGRIVRGKVATFCRNGVWCGWGGGDLEPVTRKYVHANHGDSANRTCLVSPVGRATRPVWLEHRRAAQREPVPAEPSTNPYPEPDKPVHTTAPCICKIQLSVSNCIHMYKYTCIQKPFFVAESMHIK
jgi:hypothetical protein